MALTDDEAMLEIIKLENNHREVPESTPQPVIDEKHAEVPGINFVIMTVEPEVVQNTEFVDKEVNSNEGVIINQWLCMRNNNYYLYSGSSC